MAAIAGSGCTTTISCMRSAANLYHDSDPPSFALHADCAKWVYMLRAYYASKNGLPFSYVSKIAGDAGDLRFSKTSNRALARHDLVDSGGGIDPIPVLQALHDQVWTATYRMDPAAETPVEQDFYSPKIQPGSIRPGTAIYDINGHVGIVYDVTADGRILYMDAYPDEHVSRSFYGPQFGQSPAQLGGGFKNFRPLKLVGATRTRTAPMSAARSFWHRTRPSPIIRWSSIAAMCRTRMATAPTRNSATTILRSGCSNMPALRCRAAASRSIRSMS